ncbi:MAG: hypothetical protein ACKOI2_12315, partial [Actinomycetota bacterium]
MTGEKTATFDHLTQPDPVLTSGEEKALKASARKLLEHLQRKIVQDRRHKVSATNHTNSTIRRVLGASLPESPYPPMIFAQMIQLVFDHVLTAYSDDDESAYDFRLDRGFPRETLSPTARVGSPCPAEQWRLSFRQTELRLQLRQTCGDVLPKTIGHHSPEVQQRSKHAVFMASLFLADGVLAISDHVYGFTQFDDPIGPHLVPLVRGLLD